MGVNAVRSRRVSFPADEPAVYIKKKAPLPVHLSASSLHAAARTFLPFGVTFPHARGSHRNTVERLRTMTSDNLSSTAGPYVRQREHYNASSRCERACIYFAPCYAKGAFADKAHDLLISSAASLLFPLLRTFCNGYSERDAEGKGCVSRCSSARKQHAGGGCPVPFPRAKTTRGAASDTRARARLCKQKVREDATRLAHVKLRINGSCNSDVVVASERAHCGNVVVSCACVCEKKKGYEKEKYKRVNAE